jgi:pimeloyl-ACP methyl ester carboxylesterase
VYVDLSEMLGNRVFRDDGRSIVVAARLDQRCSYCVYSPPRTSENAVLNNLLVYIHGEGRRFQLILNALRTLGNASGYMIVCPLFPANILRDGNIEGYKYLREGDLRYDEVMIDIVSEVRSAFDFVKPRFLLGGFSGGAQFAHRFLYLYPEMLEAVSIAAPGSVTLLDESLQWWPGIGSMERVFGRHIDLEALKQVDIQLVIGDADKKGGAPARASSIYWSDEWHVAGKDRVERLKSLHNSYLNQGLRAELDIVPGTSHNFLGLLPSITDFFLRSAEGSVSFERETINLASSQGAVLDDSVPTDGSRHSGKQR